MSESTRHDGETKQQDDQSIAPGSALVERAKAVVENVPQGVKFAALAILTGALAAPVALWARGIGVPSADGQESPREDIDGGTPAGLAQQLSIAPGMVRVWQSEGTRTLTMMVWMNDEHDPGVINAGELELLRWVPALGRVDLYRADDGPLFSERLGAGYLLDRQLDRAWRGRADVTRAPKAAGLTQLKASPNADGSWTIRIIDDKDEVHITHVGGAGASISALPSPVSPDEEGKAQEVRSQSLS